MKIQLGWVVAAFVLACTGLLAGCNRNGQPIEELGLEKLERGVSTEGDVVNAMGRPDTVRAEANGERVMEYPRGPMGPRTWFIVIGADGKVKDWQQVLTEQNFGRVQAGMTQEEVRHLLGRPNSVVRFSLKQEEVWDWLYRDAVMQKRLFNVHFDEKTGKVTGTSSTEAPGQSG